jgi:hypothetical protein
MKCQLILGLLAIFTLAACTVSSTQSADRPATAIASKQLADAMDLVTQKDWPKALAALRAIVDAKAFSGLPNDIQYRALSVASRVAIYHGASKLGYGYLARVIAMPQADYADWWERLREADQAGDWAELVRTVTVMMQRWPDRAVDLDADYIHRVVNRANRLPNGAAFALLQALYNAHWKFKWGIEPSGAWRDLTLLLVDKGRLAEAREVASRITDVYVLIEMRADRRLDAVVAASPGQFDIEAATEREFHALQAAADGAPQSLALKSAVIGSLLRQQHYEAALAAADSVLLDIRSTNYPEKLYEDYVEKRSSFLNLRAIALERVGRWDEAVAQMTAASLLNEKYSGNVDQLINLGDLYCELERPLDALAAIGSIVAAMSPLGSMEFESVRLEAAEQLGDTQQVKRSLDFLRAHRVDAPPAYLDSLIVVNRLDQAAHELIAQLLDKEQRQEALLSVQGFAPPPGTPRDMTLDARRHAVIARPDVQAVIERVGRIESYRVEEP